MRALWKSVPLLFLNVGGQVSAARFCVAVGIKLTFRVKQPGIVRAINYARGRGQKVGNRVLAQRGRSLALKLLIIYNRNVPKNLSLDV